MAMSVQPLYIGVDVSKAQLAICQDAQEPVVILDNSEQAIQRWLNSICAGPLYLAVEATNTYHLELVEQAYRRGHCVYLVDGLRLNRYRQSIGGRAKTDTTDAQLLRRYLQREREDLRPWEPPTKGYRDVQRLLHRRAALVRARESLKQSLRELPELREQVRALTKQMNQLDAAMQRRLREVVRECGWQEEVARCQAIEGVGLITATALTMAFHRGDFRNSDAFIAFIGLDVRVRDSGKSRGRRKLTKQGDPELRRVLHCAAMRANRSATWRDYYQQRLSQGKAKTQVLVILARKLARVAFALLKNRSVYQPKLVTGGCPVT